MCPFNRSLTCHPVGLSCQSAFSLSHHVRRRLPADWSNVRPKTAEQLFSCQKSLIAGLSCFQQDEKRILLRGVSIDKITSNEQEASGMRT